MSHDERRGEFARQTLGCAALEKCFFALAVTDELLTAFSGVDEQALFRPVRNASNLFHDKRLRNLVRSQAARSGHDSPHPAGCQGGFHRAAEASASGSPDCGWF